MTEEDEKEKQTLSFLRRETLVLLLDVLIDADIERHNQDGLWLLTENVRSALKGD